MSSEVFDLSNIGPDFMKLHADGIIVVDQQGNIVLVNAIGAQLFGYEESELVGKKVEVLLPNTAMARHQRLRELYLDKPHPRPLNKESTLTGKKKDGSIFPAEISLNPVKVKTGEYVVAQVVDISYRKQAEIAIHKERTNLQQYIDAANIIIVVIQPDQRIKLINRCGCELLGYSENELVGKNWFDIAVPPEQSAKDKKVFDQFIKENPQAFEQFENTILSRKGEEYTIDWRNTLMYDEQGQVSSVLSAGVDITAYNRVLSALLESEAKLKNIIRTAIDGIVTIDKNGLVQSFNPAAEKLFGYTASEILGESVNLLMPEPHQSKHDGYIESYLSSGIKKIIGIGREVYGLRKDGTTFPCWLSVSESNLPEKTIFIGLVHDLTKQKEAEKELKKYSEELEQRVQARTEALAHAIKGLENEIKERKQAEQALRESGARIKRALERERELNELKSRFVSVASHEFRTPLATILSSVNLIDKYHDPAFKGKRIKHIERIKSNVKDLTDILNDFLSLSKLEEGKVEARPMELHLAALISEVVEELQYQTKKEQKIIYEHKSDEHKAFLDPKLIKQILVNLVSNAIKYSDESTTIYVSTQIEIPNIYISVADQGLGISQEDQQQLFERFFRAHNVTHIQGTGLGLSIVKRYVELMEGDIQVSSEIGKGTTFLINLRDMRS